MNSKQRVQAILRYQNYDRLPVVHFGFWRETLEKWAEEGFIDKRDAGPEGDWAGKIALNLGFEFEWDTNYHLNINLYPPFQEEVLEESEEGYIKVRGGDGAVIVRKNGISSIPSQVDYLLKDRKSWEEHFLPRLQFSPDRIPEPDPNRLADENNLFGIHCGSLFGHIRNWMGVIGVAYIPADDEELFSEIIDTVGELSFTCVEHTLRKGYHFDFGHFWEDICFKNGPLVHPDVFSAKVGPHYKKITDLLKEYGIDIVSLDCDGKIDSLVPIWLENGVNTMFPIEVGTWNASIKPWRQTYGRELRGVGGVNKNIFSKDFGAVAGEIERIRPLVDLGGYIPCPDHRIAPDAKYRNVAYYCERMRKIFSK